VPAIGKLSPCRLGLTWPPSIAPSQRQEGPASSFAYSGKTRIGYGAPQKEGSHLCHGAPLGKEEVIGAKRRLGWPETEEFYVPQAVRTFFLQQLQVGERHYRRWSRRYECYRERYPEEATAYERRVKGGFADWLG